MVIDIELTLNRWGLGKITDNKFQFLCLRFSKWNIPDKYSISFEINWRLKEKIKKQLTLCVPVKDDMVLLGMKKRGFGVGRWNGFGGKVEKGETIEQGAIRELGEEAGINDGKLKKMGIIEFSFQNDEKILQVHIFKLTDFLGEPIETEEMRPQWFPFNEIPFLQMWSDDEYWFPLFLKDKLFQGKFLFDRPSNVEYSAKIITQELNEVSALK